VLEGPAERLRVILDHSQHYRHHPLYVELVHQARSSGMAGATVLPGLAGLGGSSRLHTQHALHVATETPVVVVLVDRPDSIAEFATGLGELVTGGLAARQPVEVVSTRGPAGGGQAKLGDAKRPAKAKRLGAPSDGELRTGPEERGGHMRLEGVGKRLTIYCGEADRHGHEALADALVELARQERMAGATVLRGIEGFGASSHLHTSRLLSLSDDLPVVIEIIDAEDRIMSILPRVEAMMGDGLITLEDLDVWLYRAQARAAPDDG
jgi:PII-like signaling protein